MTSYNYLLSLQNKKHSLIIICAIFINIIFVLLITIGVYDSYDTLGVYDGNHLLLKIQQDNSDNIINGDFIKINNKELNYQVKGISELKVENYINYYEILIDVNENFEKNEVIKITFYNNKEKLMKKIIDFIF